MEHDVPSSPKELDLVRQRALALWDHQGLECAIAAGFAVCGYVRVPEGHPWRAVSEAARLLDVAARAIAGQIDSGGFTDSDLCDDMPGGLTYGPDPFGWVGFDTGHAGDAWASDDLPADIATRNCDLGEMFNALVEEAASDTEREALRRVQDMLSQRVTSDTRTVWTMPRLRAEVERLAETVNAAWRSSDIA